MPKARIAIALVAVLALALTVVYAASTPGERISNTLVATITAADASIPGERISNALVATITATKPDRPPSPPSDDGPSGGGGGGGKPRKDKPGEVVTPPPPPPSPGPGPSFADTRGHWAEDAIRQLAARGIITGYPDGTFSPDNPVTRAEIVKMLVLAAGLQPSEGRTTFADEIPSWAAPYIAAAVDHSLIAGYEDGTFRSDEPLTREQLAVLVTRVLRGGELQGGTTFSDAGEISDWAAPSVAYVVRLGVLQCYPDGTFRPKQAVTRAEAAMVILRLIEYLER